ncbi:murein biosynthesis integral membrane protein MurJ [Ruminococcus flavefaciens]|uniref:Putative peptidoglycan lipid II flippase n=1 Tax=Ruminococcus flavefaciens TaxID=1265 RepID=A0A315Y2G5_RUMFL|nr:lipid II flippase MurJ [Ruminococcus flavefaciens]PWJ14692.1 putative peptidoglycan lipid II flippase [Ruminococcus flavefaciens]SSA42722.1 putative peptidoglycan lipid II flippase [Ruminococcus flavefaciens]
MKTKVDKKRSIVFSSLIVTIATFSIKALGLIKQSVLASICGASTQTDAFFVATGIIGQLAVVLFSAISITLLSMYSRERVKNGDIQANCLLTSTIAVFLPISFLLTFLFFVFARPIAIIMAPSYSENQLSCLIHYLRIMSIAYVPWCIYLTLNVSLEANNSFLPGKGQGLFQNVFLIVGAILLYHKYGMDVLVYAFLLSGVAQCVLVAICGKKYFKPHISKEKIQVVIKELLPLAIPLMLGNAIYEVNDIVDKQISLALGSGMASLLTYGSTLNEIVTGVIVASVATVLFANYANWAANNEIDKIITNLKSSINNLLLLITPIMIMCIVAGDQIVGILYGRGNFGEYEIKVTYYVVIGYALGFIFQSIRAILVKVYYAFQDTRTPMINGMIAVFVNIVLSIILSKYIGVMGIALATSIGMFIVTIALAIGIKKHLSNFYFHECLSECFKDLFSGVVAAILLYFIKNFININTVIDFIIEGSACIVIYISILILLKSKSLKSASQLLKRGK